MASLPLKTYVRPTAGGPAVRYNGPSFFDSPSVTANLYDWIFTCMTSLLLQGNAWGMITGKDGFGYPTSIEWIPAEFVTVVDDDRQPFNPLRTRVYVYGRMIPDWRSELLHIRAFALPGRTEGISPLRSFALTVMNGLEAERYGTDWFAAGGFPTGTFRNMNLEIDRDLAQQIREDLTGAIRRHEPIVYGKDWEYNPIKVPPSEAQFIESLQMNATQMAAIYGLPPDRVGGRRGDSLTYNCLTTDSDILTTRGWLQYDQVTTDDTCLTLNTETGLAEWQPVVSVHIFEDGPYPVIRLESKSHSSVSTPNHRWPVTSLMGAPGWQWKTTETLGSDSRVAMAVPVVAPVEAKYSDSLTELVAWFWTEGWIGKSGAVTIAQSDAVNPGNVARIRAALTELFGLSAADRGMSLLGSRGWQKRELIREELARNPQGTNRGIARICGSDAHTVRNLRQGLIGQHDNGPGWQEDCDDRGLVHFRLNAQAGAVLTRHAPGKVVTTEFLSQLTRAQLELFYQTSIDADGTRRPWPEGRGEVIAQRDRARLDAFQVACALTGRAGVIRENSAGMYVLCIRANPLVKPAGHPEYVTHETAPAVWCVQTPNKSWFARRNGTCYFSGNTVEQSTLQVIDALRPWMVRLETAFFNLIPGNRYVRFNSDALLKTDLKTRTEIYMQQRNMGLLTTDEIRDREDLPPLPGSAGGEVIPLEVMVAMSRSIRGIPKSMLPQLELEMDLAAERLEKLAKETPPGTIAPPGPVAGAQAMLGRIVSAQRNFEDLSTDDIVALMREASARLRQQASAGTGTPEPEYLGAGTDLRVSDRGPEHPLDTDMGDIVIPSKSDVPHGPAMYTAHRIDEITNHLAHGTERIDAARRAAPGDARDYEAEHVLLDLGQAHAAIQRLVGNIRKNYPAEAAELDKIEKITTPASSRAAALSSSHKAVSFAHLLQTTLYDTGHAVRHAQVMQHETDAASAPLWNFDSEHCAHHLSGALEHVHKLASHVKDNYPAEGKALAVLQDLAAGPANDMAQLKKLNGHAMNGSK